MGPAMSSSLRNREPSSKPVVKGLFGNAAFNGQVLDHKAFILELVKHISSFVSGLLVHGRPGAISRLIVAIHVISFDAVQMAWRLSHVIYEVLKTFGPPGAHANAATAIVGKRLVACNGRAYPAKY